MWKSAAHPTHLLPKLQHFLPRLSCQDLGHALRRQSAKDRSSRNSECLRPPVSAYLGGGLGWLCQAILAKPGRQPLSRFLAVFGGVTRALINPQLQLGVLRAGRPGNRFSGFCTLLLCFAPVMVGENR